MTDMADINPEWKEARAKVWDLRRRIHARITALLDEDATLQHLMLVERAYDTKCDGIRGRADEDSIWHALDEETMPDFPYQELTSAPAPPAVLTWERN